MRIVVSGSSGFIGSAVTSRLKEDGHEVYPLDSRMGCDIRSAHAVHEVFKRARAECCVHLAGVLGTAELFDTIDEAIAVNIQGTANVLAACRAVDARYVAATMLPIFPSIYTATKVAAHRLASAHHHAFGMPVCHVRAYNAYGAGQANGPGHPRKIIPTFACDAWAHRPVRIWGDGSAGVDLVHVDAVADVFADAVHVGDDSIIDAGTGHAMTVNDTARVVLEVTGSHAGVSYEPMRIGEIPQAIRATGEGWHHLRSVPQWEPEKLADTIRSYREHPTAQR